MSFADLIGRALLLATAAAAAGRAQPLSGPVATTLERPRSANGVTTTVEGGTIEGVRSGDVISFKGIPYAAPPVGHLRWRPPQPVVPWTGVRRATDFGARCVQKSLPGDAGADAPSAEDCLVANVWRPATIAKGQRLPILVWIHGGAFIMGASSTPITDGAAFARDTVVFISFNYRLGRLGFFGHPALTASGDEPFGNYAFMDQLAALRWVRRNARAFGGDSTRVTLAGESAGGLSVIHHLVWPKSKGLFHRAVVMSGGGRSYLLGGRQLSHGTKEFRSAEETGVQFARSKGIDGTGPDALAALRALPADQVTGDLGPEALFEGRETYAGGPIFDGMVVAFTPEDLFAAGTVVSVPLIIGTTTADLGILDPTFRADPMSYFGPHADEGRALYANGDSPDVREVATALGADLIMHEPARFLATRARSIGTPAWLYRFGYVPDSLRAAQRGAPHASELPFLFRTLDGRYGTRTTKRDRAAARAFHAYIANFVKRGTPNGKGLPTWPTFDRTKSKLMLFPLSGTPTVRVDPFKDRLDLVDRIISRR